MDQMRVLELFAGVGGFRLGLEQANKTLRKKVFDVVWSNQWEPSTKTQFASNVYVRAFSNEGHVNQDISSVSSEDVPYADLLVGGFPCQDYSVATALQRSKGLQGAKGVLWWEIHRILRDARKRPKYLFLENVDRLLKSPASQRGRDFAVMLASLSDLGYGVEWRVINSADYGMPQRRRRVFIMGYLEGTAAHAKISGTHTHDAWLTEDGILARAFKVKAAIGREEHDLVLDGHLSKLTREFGADSKKSPFQNAGTMVNRKVHTRTLEADFRGNRKTLSDVLDPEDAVPERYFITDNLAAWRRYKGPKRIPMINKATGEEYIYAEGGIAFPDHLDQPSRTVVTGEGGAGPSRFKHVVMTESGRYRRLTPVELERLNQFPDGHTEGLSDTQRAFLMGNALVVGVVKRIGLSLARHHSQENESFFSDTSPEVGLAAAD